MLTSVFHGRIVGTVKPTDTTPPPIAGEADTERESRFDAARVTLEFGQKSTRRMDAGRKPISESPLFGGTAQEEMF